MLLSSRLHDCPPGILAMLAVFLLGLMLMVPPSCKCPKGLTHPQCNFTNSVCLMRMMFIDRDLSNFRIQAKAQLADDCLEEVGSSDSSASWNLKCLKYPPSDCEPKRRNTKSYDAMNFKNLEVRYKLILYYLYPLLLLALAALLYAPAFIRCFTFEKDISILKNMLATACSAADERRHCIRKLTNDLTFLIRYTEGNIYKNVSRMHALRWLVPGVILLLVAAPALWNTSLVSWTSIRSVTVEVFPSSAICQFSVVTESVPVVYTTFCALPASTLLQILTPVILLGLCVLLVSGVCANYTFSKMMSPSSQMAFYSRHIELEGSDGRILLDLFGIDAFIIFTAISECDESDMLQTVLNNLAS